MKRLLVIAAAALVAVLAFHRPAAPAIVVAASPSPPASQHWRKGHPLRVSANSSVVYVVGAVRRTGLYALPAGSRVSDAIERAGGLLSDADPAAVNMAQRVSDGDEIDVARAGDATPRPTRRKRRKRSIATAYSPAPIDLNTADNRALATVPGIGATLAERIVEYRRINGPFASLDELADVAGMTQSRIDALGAYVTVGSTQ